MLLHTLNMFKIVTQLYNYIVYNWYSPFAATITLPEIPISSKPVTVTEQMYSPASWASSGENVIVLPNFNLWCDLAMV